MKRSLTAAAWLLALSLTAASARGGDDPLISLSYLQGTYSQSLDAAVAARLDAADQALRDAAGSLLSGGNAVLKEGDVLQAPAGLAFTLLEGGVRVSGGAAVDVTAGRETAPGSLESGHRYVAAEDAAFTVTSPAAVVSWAGGGILTPSDQPDCYAIASALRSLDLFRGTGSGIGEGFDLCRAPTRGEGMVLFIRLLGEEADALACTYRHPFADVPDWLDRYAAWAYEKGYSNGVSDMMFDADRPISAVEYVELLLRALGYSAAGTSDYAASLERALDRGVLTGGECEMLKEQPFCRAHAVYLSYYSLDTPISGTRDTLARRMTAKGLLTGERLDAARTRVKTSRLS